MNPVKTGALIREQRIENHLTEQELAEKAGISVELLESYEQVRLFSDASVLKEADRAAGPVPDGTDVWKEAHCRAQFPSSYDPHGPYSDRL